MPERKEKDKESVEGEKEAKEAKEKLPKATPQRQLTREELEVLRLRLQKKFH